MSRASAAEEDVGRGRLPESAERVAATLVRQGEDRRPRDADTDAQEDLAGHRAADVEEVVGPEAGV